MDDWGQVGPGEPRPGDVVAGKYELVRRIGRGGMGSVFEARHAALGRPLAIKFLRPEVADERDVIERFFREARSAASIAHPRIVDVFDVGWSDDGLLPWFAMELLEGRSLAEELAQHRGLPAVRATPIACQILDALEAAHARGIIHRDLKPENVFLIRHGLEDDVKVLDFGISKVMAKRITVTGVILGTAAYMAPEQAKGARDIDHRADLYAVGALLFEMLAGRPPFEGANYHQVLLAIVTGERPTLQELRPNLHPGLAAATERALAADPTQRWESAAAMRDGLTEVLDAIDALLGRGQETSLPSEVKTVAWTPRARIAEAPAAEPELQSAPAEPPRPAPTPLLAGVRPSPPEEPTVVRGRRGLLFPALLLAGLLLGAAAMAAFLFLANR